MKQCIANFENILLSRGKVACYDILALYQLRNWPITKIAYSKLSANRQTENLPLMALPVDIQWSSIYYRFLGNNNASDLCTRLKITPQSPQARYDQPRNIWPHYDFYRFSVLRSEFPQMAALYGQRPSESFQQHCTALGPLRAELPQVEISSQIPRGPILADGDRLPFCSRPQHC